MKRVREIFAYVMLVGSVLAILGGVAYQINKEREAQESFRQQNEPRPEGRIQFSDCYPKNDDTSSLLVGIGILSGLTAFALWSTKSLIWPAVLSFAMLVPYAVWYSNTQRDLSMAELDSVVGIDLYFYGASTLDVVVLALVSCVCVAQLTALINAALHAVRKTKLP